MLDRSHHSRHQQYLEFLDKGGIKYASLEPIVSDASTRKYYRVTSTNEKTYVLMDSALELSSLASFIQISEFLEKNKISAPKVFYSDLDSGLLLLEDLGKISINEHLNYKTNTNNTYRLVIELLHHIQTLSPPTNLEAYSNEILLRELKIGVNTEIVIDKKLFEEI